MAALQILDFYKQFTPDLVVASDYAVVFSQIGTTPPTPSFSATVDSSTTSSLAPLTVQFTDASISPSSAITSWSWDFGDGNTSTAQNPSHVYMYDGVYDVKLTVQNSTGSATQIQSGIVVVTNPVMQVPVQVVLDAHNAVPSFTASVTSGAHPLSVAFTDTTSGNPYQWIWDFGDGGKSNVQNPTYQFGHAGTFDVSLFAANAAGSGVPAHMTITVS